MKKLLVLFASDGQFHLVVVFPTPLVHPEINNFNNRMPVVPAYRHHEGHWQVPVRDANSYCGNSAIKCTNIKLKFHARLNKVVLFNISVTCLSSTRTSGRGRT